MGHRPVRTLVLVGSHRWGSRGLLRLRTLLSIRRPRPLPVAAPPLRSLRGLQGVFTGDDLVGAASAALAGERPDPERVRAEHGWDERVGTILDTVGLDSSDHGDPVRISIRSIPRYSDSERRLF